MNSRWTHYLIVTLFASAILLTNLGGPRLWDRDEPRNASCAAEMLARGDWIVPVMNAELRTHKPVLLYWFIMASYELFGINEFSARLPSALLALGTALCTYEMGRRIFSQRAGLWAAIAVSSSLMFVVAGRAATPDSTLIFFSTLAITVFVLRAFPKGTNESASSDKTISPSRPIDFPTSWTAAATIYAILGIAVLAKGPVGLVLPTAVMGMFLLIMRLRVGSAEGTTESRTPSLFERGKRLVRGIYRVFAPLHFLKTCWAMRPLTAIAVCLAVAAPWYIAVGVKTDGEFLRGFFLEHNLSRAMQPMEGHRGNILFYPLSMLVGFFPWSVFAVPLLIDTVMRLRQRDTWRNGYIFAVCWMAVYVAIFSLAKTKLPSYVTPCYPALALLAGAFVDRWLAGVTFASRRWQLAAVSVFAMVGLAIAVAVPILATELLPGEGWLGLIGIVPVLGGIACIVAILRDQRTRAASTFAFTGAAFLALLFGFGAQRVTGHQEQNRLWEFIHATSSQPRVAAFACLEPSWVFYGGHPIDEISHENVGPTHSPWVEVGGKWKPKPRVEISELVAAPDDTFIITTGEQLERVQKLLPSDFKVLETVPFFLKEDRLVLLGRDRRIATREADGTKR